MIDEAAACLRDIGWHEAQVTKAEENQGLWLLRRQEHELAVVAHRKRYGELVSQIQRRANGSTDGDTGGST